MKFYKILLLIFALLSNIQFSFAFNDNEDQVMQAIEDLMEDTEESSDEEDENDPILESLIKAIDSGNINDTKKLLSQENASQLVNLTEKNGIRPLLIALDTITNYISENKKINPDHFEILKLLLIKGALINNLVKENDHEDEREENSALVFYLQQLADINYDNMKLDDIFNDPVIKLLINYKADLHKAVSWAANFGYYKFIIFLIQINPDAITSDTILNCYDEAINYDNFNTIDEYISSLALLIYYCPDSVLSETVSKIQFYDENSEEIKNINEAIRTGFMQRYKSKQKLSNSNIFSAIQYNESNLLIKKYNK